MKTILMIVMVISLTACGKEPAPREITGIEKENKTCAQQGGVLITLQSPDKCRKMGKFCIKKTETSYSYNDAEVEVGSCEYYEAEYYFNS